MDTEPRILGTINSETEFVLNYLDKKCFYLFLLPAAKQVKAYLLKLQLLQLQQEVQSK